MTTLRERSGDYLRNAPGGLNLEKIAFYIALGFGVYYVWKALSLANIARKGLNATGSAIGTGLYSLFNPTEGERLVSTMYTTYFPNENAFHAVDTIDMDKSGKFARNGIRYQMLIVTKPYKLSTGRVVNNLAQQL